MGSYDVDIPIACHPEPGTMGLLRVLRADRLHTWEQCLDLAKAAASENRAFTRSEQSAWDMLNFRLDSYDCRIRVLLDVMGTTTPWPPWPGEWVMKWDWHAAP